MASLRKSLQRFAEDLQLFSGQLSQETAELRRNVEQRPITGATNFRHCLEDISERLAAVGEELQALEAVSLDAISLEELVGHCVALYQVNHAAIAQLEQRLQQYGYRDLYAPLPPENPLDMLMLRAPPGAHPRVPAETHAVASLARGTEAARAREPLEHITNSLAATGLQEEAPGSAPRPRTVAKALAPMTAAKGRVRSDTPSSLSSPFEAMSPSMRELLGKYACSSGGPPSQYSMQGTPYSQATPVPAMGQLSPAFEAARLAAEQQAGAAAAAAEATPVLHERTPEAGGAAGGWQADPTVYNALTATAKKLATKPEFLDQYRQRFPHIVASTERLLASVEKQPRGSGAGSAASGGLPQHPGLAAVAGAGGPMAALAAAAVTASGMAAQQQQQHGSAGPSRLGAMGARYMEEEEETTMQLYSQVISSRPYPPAPEDGLAAEEPATQLQGPSLTPARPTASASPAAGATPSTEQLLSRAFSITGHASSSGGSQAPSGGLRSHPISTLAGSGSADDAVAPAVACPPSAAVASSIARATAAQLAGSAAAVGATSAAAGATACADRSRPELQDAIEAALRRSTAPQAAAAAPASVPPSYPAASSAPLSAAAARPAAPAVSPAPAAGVAQAPPPLRPVADQEYEGLPSFIRGQLSLDQVNGTLALVHGMVAERAAAGCGMAGFTLEDLDGLGMGPKAKVFINSIVKLGRAQLKVVYGQGTVYLLL